MKPFTYERANSPAEAAAAVARNPAARFIAGGTNLLDLMKEDVERPTALVDITRLPLTQIQAVPGGVLLGALARNAATANHPLIRQQYPLLSQAILAGASAQIRNMATNGGNLLQRTRCAYFYDTALPCNKRQPGSGCAALAGNNRLHALFGWSEQCVAVYPSDPPVALLALGASLRIAGPGGERVVAVGDFLQPPSEDRRQMHTLAPDELIVEVLVPPPSGRSVYLKAMDRAIWAYALVSVAVSGRVEQGRVHDARIVLGGVANVPVRCTAVEGLVEAQTIDEALLRQAGEAAIEGATPLEHNGYKLPLARNLVMQGLRDLIGSSG